MRELMPHQVAAFNRFKDQDHAAFIMEMRLGKTITSIRWLIHRLKARKIKPNQARVLILAPASPIVSWQEELDKEGIAWQMVKGDPKIRRERIANRVERWCLMQYETLIHTPEALDAEWDAVLFDESTAIKNPRAQVTKRVLRCFNEIPIQAILTGLVNPESLREVWTQFAAAHGGLFMGCSNYWTWEQRHFFKIVYDWLPRKDSADKIRESTRDAGFFLTRQEAGIGSVKIRERLHGELKGDALAAYRKAVKTWEVPGIEAKHAVVVATWLRRMVGGHMPGKELECWKYGAVLDLLKEQLREEQVVIWFSFNLELARMWRELKRAGISATWVAGELDVAERRRRRALFAKGQRRVFLCQVACGKYGLDLSAADTEIYFSSPWSFEGRRQSEDRIEHPLKKSPLLVLDLVTERTVDEDVLESLAEKNESAEWLSQRIMNSRRAG